MSRQSHRQNPDQPPAAASSSSTDNCPQKTVDFAREDADGYDSDFEDKDHEYKSKIADKKLKAQVSAKPTTSATTSSHQG